MRLQRRLIPEQLKEHKKELLGEVTNNTMVDCVYNAVLAGEITPIKTGCFSEILPDYLKDYQINDLNKSLQSNTVFNINKPGYGKTLETILWIKLTLKKDFKALVLCPKSVITTWENQLRQYWPSYCVDGMWWITNYEQLYDETRFAIAKSFLWDVIVLDESHKIKSSKSKITIRCMHLKSRARHCLTGTPIKNRPEDLASQLKWLDPYSITNVTDFKNAFCHLVADKWGVRSCGLTKNPIMVENLQKLLDVYCVGGESHPTGEIEHMYIKLKMYPEVKALYDKTVGEWDKETKQRVIDTAGLLEQGVKVSNAIEAATRRQQITSNCQLFDKNLKNIKFEWIANWLEGTDEKVVIFSKYAETIAYLEEYLRGRFSIAVVKKEQSVVARNKIIEDWKKSKQALLSTTKLLGTGFDGLQNVCRYIIFVDREWNSSDNKQAEGRVYRTGQKDRVIIYILQAPGTIDIQIERVQKTKALSVEKLLEFVEDD